MSKCTLASNQSLQQDLVSLGFIEGAPSHIPPANVAADVRIYRVYRCGECGHRGHKVMPYHRNSEYRLVLECRSPSCGHQTEA